ncbi:SDR family NAD(P)-dependent oxidoreductase [Bosea caraganae]|uniref:SDR family NAD(P)-dependent oxidoreductase n=1 Tax=Bosea caraganae TaxID=2763117 RepID=A0A370LAK4_9HYPH|nr:glucose 1-dehydrogenase [Bosea caraganae]RDJ22031.1 SDR family NAD(P)-dependent oxidoreductase [Bosea caraganae]RDJ27936.1 SDR family NAD(P)-dependent oxidoreductase [Bosea caraganae]
MAQAHTNAHQASSLAGRVALITGGGSGIGQAAAFAYARAGAKVVVAGRRPAELEATVAQIENAGGEGLAVPTDVSVASEVQALVQRTLEKFGRLDIAFNNAGTTGHFAPISEQTPEDFDLVIGANLKGVWLGIKYQLEAFRAQGRGGVIVNTSSWLAVGAVAGSSTYSASKGALDALIRAIAIEAGPDNIRINNVNPGLIDTDMAREGLDGGKAYGPFIARTPLGRAGNPSDVGDVAVWLSSDEARFITGQSILVDGGYTIGGIR